MNSSQEPVCPKFVQWHAFGLHTSAALEVDSSWSEAYNTELWIYSNKAKISIYKKEKIFFPSFSYLMVICSKYIDFERSWRTASNVDLKRYFHLAKWQNIGNHHVLSKTHSYNFANTIKLSLYWHKNTQISQYINLKIN